MASPPTSFVLCIDVEPRGRQFVSGSAEEWAGFLTCFDYLNDWRRRYFDETGRKANFCWLLRLDNQILHAHGSRAWFIDVFRQQMQALLDAGDAIGLHHHMFAMHDGVWREDFTQASLISSLMQDRDAFVDALG